MRTRHALIYMLGLLLLASIMAGGWFAWNHYRPRGIRSIGYDFGQARDGDYVFHEFHLHNPGSSTLNVAQVTPSCTCTVVGDKPSTIEPRSSVVIPVKVHVRGDGPFQSTILVSFKDAPAIVLRVHGNVIAQHPAEVTFGEVRRDEPAVRSFYLRSASKVPLVIDHVEKDPTIEVQYQRPSPDSTDIAVRVSLQRNLPAGPFAQIIRFVTNDDKSPNMDVRVEGYVVGSFEVFPHVLDFGLVAPGERKQLQLRVTAPYGDRLQMDRVVSSDIAVICGEPKPVNEQSGGLLIPVQLNSGFKDKVLKGEIQITATIKGNREVRMVEVYAMKG